MGGVRFAMGWRRKDLEANQARKLRQKKRCKQKGLGIREDAMRFLCDQIGRGHKQEKEERVESRKSRQSKVVVNGRRVFHTCLKKKRRRMEGAKWGRQEGTDSKKEAKRAAASGKRRGNPGTPIEMIKYKKDGKGKARGDNKRTKEHKGRATEAYLEG